MAKPAPRLEIYCRKKLAGMGAMRCGMYQATDGCGVGCADKADAATVRALHVLRDGTAKPAVAILADVETPNDLA